MFQVIYEDKLKEIKSIYLDLSPSGASRHDYWAVRLGVKGTDDACTFIGYSPSPMIKALDVLPDANFVFQTGQIPDMLVMLGKIMDAQQEMDNGDYSLGSV